eukprot:869139-Prorocentrum_minimum.AAC.3
MNGKSRCEVGIAKGMGIMCKSFLRRETRAPLRLWYYLALGNAHACVCWGHIVYEEVLPGFRLFFFSSFIPASTNNLFTCKHATF